MTLSRDNANEKIKVVPLFHKSCERSCRYDRTRNDGLNADISHRHCDGTKRHDET